MIAQWGKALAGKPEFNPPTHMLGKSHVLQIAVFYTLALQYVQPLHTVGEDVLLRYDLHTVYNVSIHSNWMSLCDCHFYLFLNVREI